MKNPLNNLLVLALLFVFASHFVLAATYTKNSFPTSSGNVISCDGTDRRLSCHDTGSGKNHNCVPVAINSCQAFEGRNNFGGPGCLIICEKEDRCTDGTLQGFCSQNVPFFCDNGNLVKRASVCGCPGNLVRSGEDCVQQQAQAQTCNDNTAFGQCSQTRPLFCDNGNLVNRAGSCGCPGGQVASGDNCVAQQPQGQTCNDNTAFGQCSQTRPLFCENGNLVNRAGSCGCPGGQIASGNNCVPGNQVTSSAGNKLVITDIDAKIDGRPSSNIDDNDRIGKEAKPESDVELKITVKNDFTSGENIDIEDVTIIATIEGVGEMDLEDESNSFDLRPQSDKTATLRFKLPLDMEEGDYSIAIEAQGEDENGDEHTDQADVELEVQKERHDLRFLSFDLNPRIVECNKGITANARVMNIGSEDESNAAIRINADNEAGIAQDNFPIQSDNSVTRLIKSSIGDNLEPDQYSLTAGLYSSDGSLKDTRTLSLKVLNCTASGLFPVQQIIVGYDTIDTGFLSGLLRGIDWRGLVFFLAIIIIVLLVIVIIVSLAAGMERQDI